MAVQKIKLITDITLELTGDERLYMVSAKQGDKQTRYVRITLTNNGKVFMIPTGYILIANIKKPDKHFCYNECKVEDNKVLVELTNQALAAAGTAHCDIEIRDEQNTYVLSSQAFTIEIEETNRNDAAIESCNEITVLEEKVQRYIDNIIQTKQEFLSTEAAMKIAEEARASAEDERNNSEAQRRRSEKERETSEAARQQRFQTLQEAEEGRASAEVGRNNAEAQRKKSEKERETSETARTKAEVDRNDSEVQRKKNENERETSEAVRQQQLQTMQEAAEAAKAAAAACQDIEKGINSMSDVATGKKYTIGVEDGLVFLEETT